MLRYGLINTRVYFMTHFNCWSYFISEVICHFPTTYFQSTPVCIVILMGDIVYLAQTEIEFTNSGIYTLNERSATIQYTES